MSFAKNTDNCGRWVLNCWNELEIIERGSLLFGWMVTWKNYRVIEAWWWEFVQRKANKPKNPPPKNGPWSVKVTFSIHFRKVIVSYFHLDKSTFNELTIWFDQPEAKKTQRARPASSVNQSCCNKCMNVNVVTIYILQLSKQRRRTISLRTKNEHSLRKLDCLNTSCLLLLRYYRNFQLMICFITIVSRCITLN